nr:MAG: replication initiator protein [Microvirus sp.]
MKCADPVLCYTDSKGNKKYRHFSLSSHIHKLAHQLVFDCGKCLFCRKKKSYELASRCVLHASLYTDNCFLTLTYDEKKEGYHNVIDYTDIQKFKKRLRKKCHPKKIEIFNVHEYGKNGKKHWHLVVFNHDFSDKTVHTIRNGIALYTSKALEILWPFGFNTIGAVETASAMYAAQYMEKDIANRNCTNGKRAKSNHSGIGRSYFMSHYRQILMLGYVPINGRKLPLPRYFQKLAHKHYCHFYEKSAFFDTTDRKRLYTPFKIGQENKEIADLFIEYKNIKAEKILEMEKEWNAVISQHLTEKTKPDFIRSNENALYDLNKKTSLEKF